MDESWFVVSVYINPRAHIHIHTCIHSNIHTYGREINIISLNIFDDSLLVIFVSVYCYLVNARSPCQLIILDNDDRDDDDGDYNVDDDDDDEENSTSFDWIRFDCAHHIPLRFETSFSTNYSLWLYHCENVKYINEYLYTCADKDTSPSLRHTGIYLYYQNKQSIFSILRLPHAWKHFPVVFFLFLLRMCTCMYALGIGF